MHPLSPNMKRMTESELENKIQELTTKYFQTHNQQLQNQIKMFLDEYKGELEARRRKTWEDQYSRRDKDLDKLINVT